MLHAQKVAEGKDDCRARFGPGEYPRSAQLHGTDPVVMAAAAERLITEQGLHHIDLNFGCPMPKVLKKGGGAAIPTNPELLRKIVSAVVDVARPHGVPVTAKIRLGMDWVSLNYPTTGRIIEECGASAITLHARTVSDMYIEGAARRNWIHIFALTGEVDIPVIGNGDIFSATDALRMMNHTECAGIAIGRACLGRPWLFQDIANAYRLKWSSEVTVPDFDVVSKTMMEHLESEVAWQIAHGGTEAAAVESTRKWFGWYWKGYNGMPHGWVPRMCQERTIDGVRRILEEANPENISYDYHIVVGKRGKYDSPRPKPREPPMPRPIKRTASQRLPKSEKGLQRLAAREDKLRNEYNAQVQRVREFRRKMAEPRRRAKAKTVQDEIAKRGIKTGPKPVSPRKKRSQNPQETVRPLSAKEEDALNFIEFVKQLADVGDEPLFTENDLDDDEDDELFFLKNAKPEFPR